MAKIEIYKKGQGKYTRVTTFMAVLLVVVIGIFLAVWQVHNTES